VSIRKFFSECFQWDSSISNRQMSIRNAVAGAQWRVARTLLRSASAGPCVSVCNWSFSSCIGEPRVFDKASGVSVRQAPAQLGAGSNAAEKREKRLCGRQRLLMSFLLSSLHFSESPNQIGTVRGRAELYLSTESGQECRLLPFADAAGCVRHGAGESTDRIVGATENQAQCIGLQLLFVGAAGDFQHR
jgi:hypothetical protein